MANQLQAQFKHDDQSVRREFDNVYKALRTIHKALLLDISEIEPANKIDGLRWYKPSTDTLKEWAGAAGWKQLHPGVFAE